MNSANAITTRSGFTLIELSIVLVIIGLIVGGVMVGRNLIKAAELRGYMSTLDKLNVAILTFRSKYACLPGDCPNVTTFFPTGNAGDGDGLIDANFWTASNIAGFDSSLSETTELYNHLALANMINLTPFDRTDGALIAVDGGWIRLKAVTGLFPIAYGGVNYTKVGGQAQFPGLVGTNVAMNISALTSFEAASIDDKLDDGLPHSGKITNHIEVDTYLWTGNCSTATAYLRTDDASTQCGLLIAGGY